MKVRIVDFKESYIHAYFGDHEMDVIPIKDDKIDFQGKKERYILNVESRKFFISYYNEIFCELKVEVDKRIDKDQINLDNASVDELKCIIERLIQKDTIRDMVIPCDSN